MIRLIVTRFCTDRRGGAAIDYAMAFALLFATRALAGAHGAALSAAIAPLLPA